MSRCMGMPRTTIVYIRINKYSLLHKIGSYNNIILMGIKDYYREAMIITKVQDKFVKMQIVMMKE